MKAKKPSKPTAKSKTKNPVPTIFTTWVEAEKGRAAYFSKIDPGLFAPLISKMKKGIVPISFEYAIRLERAQKASDNPFKADEIMTSDEHRELYAYVTGQKPAPKQVKYLRKNARESVQASA